MAKKDIKRIGDAIHTIFILAEKDTSFITGLEGFLSTYAPAPKEAPVVNEKLHQTDLFQLIREKTEAEVEKILDGFTVRELREILKKYHFGSSSKLKTSAQIKQYILNQLIQRKTDVFGI